MCILKVNPVPTLDYDGSTLWDLWINTQIINLHTILKHFFNTVKVRLILEILLYRYNRVI